MSGFYFKPLERVFLNLSGGTVTGDTIFTEGVYGLRLTGDTIYSGDTKYKDGLIYISTSVNIALSDAERGVYTTSWSADTVGEYQLYVKK